MPTLLATCISMAQPLVMPEGSERWEASVRLSSSDVETQRLPLLLRAPARILFIRPTVIVLGNPLLLSNQLADQFWAKIDIDDRTFLTTSNAGIATNSPTTGNEVTFGSYADILLNIFAASPTPQFGFTFKSKQAAGAFGGDVLISATLCGYYVDANGDPIVRKVTA